jgi:hypothetical protein
MVACPGRNGGEPRAPWFTCQTWIATPLGARVRCLAGRRSLTRSLVPVMTEELAEEPWAPEHCARHHLGRAQAPALFKKTGGHRRNASASATAPLLVLAAAGRGRPRPAGYKLGVGRGHPRVMGIGPVPAGAWRWSGPASSWPRWTW